MLFRKIKKQIAEIPRLNRPTTIVNGLKTLIISNPTISVIKELSKIANIDGLLQNKFILSIPKHENKI